ncbi:MAG: GDSL-type esterase/lipase family protein [Anaerolineales bacterium]
MTVNRKVNKYKSIVIGALLFALFASVIINIVLFKELLTYYKLLYSSELDPLGLSYFQDTETQASTGLPVVVFFGDSRAAQWITPQTTGYTFINRGIGNQTSAQVANRFDAHIKPLHPQVVIIQVGINDLKTIPLFPERKQEIIENCEANIQKIIQNSLDANATVILTTIFPTSGNVPLTRRLVWSDDIYQAIDEVNSFLRSLQNERVLVFDAANIISNTDGNTKLEYSLDLLHLNTNGYETLNFELIKILQSLQLTLKRK